MIIIVIILIFIAGKNQEEDTYINPEAITRRKEKPVRSKNKSMCTEHICNQKADHERENLGYLVNKQIHLESLQRKKLNQIRIKKERNK